MPDEASQTLYYLVIQDSSVLGVVIGVFLAGVFVARRLGFPASYGLGSLGLARPKTRYLTALGLGLAVGVGALLLSVLVLPVSTYVVEWLGYSADRSVQEPFMRELAGWIGERPGIAIPATILAVVLFAPAVEEIIFRGAFFGGLRKLTSSLLRVQRGDSKGSSKVRERVSFVLAAIISSTAFALLHGEPVIFIMLFVLALALCAIYQRTGSLLASFTAHATFNSFATLIIILVGLGILPGE